MTILLWILLLLTVAPPVTADNTSNAVNERIPVSKAAMEAHWQVDCSSLWKQLKEGDGGVALDCPLPVDLKKQLTLCAFIYQPPGEALAYPGPDYRSIVDAQCYLPAFELDK